MSVASWALEFLQRDTFGKGSVIDACNQSILKWEGLLKKNLRRHNVRFDRDSTTIDDKDNYLKVCGDANCALCCQFYLAGKGCKPCPLYQVLGGRCDAVHPVPNAGLPLYQQATEGGNKNIRLMLKWLHIALGYAMHADLKHTGEEV